MRIGTHVQSETDLTVGSPFGVIVKFAIPILFSTLLTTLFHSVDSLIVGRFLGENALAAVGSTGSLIVTLNSLFSGFSIGAGVVISRYYGMGELEKLSGAVHTAITTAFLIGIVFSATGTVLARPLLVMMRSDPAVIEDSARYLRFYLGGSFSLMMYEIMRGIMTAVGDSRRPLIFMFAASALNVLCDYIAIALFGLGVEWAAIATVASQSLGAILCLTQFLRKGRLYSITLNKLRIERNYLRIVLKNGMPVAMMTSVVGFANVVRQLFVNGFGDGAMAAFSAYGIMSSYAFLPSTAFASALTTFVGQNIGARKYDRVKKGGRNTLTLAIALSALVGVAVFFFGEDIVGWIVKDADAETLAIIRLLCRTESLFYGVLAVAICIPGICRGSPKAIVHVSVIQIVQNILWIGAIVVFMSVIPGIETLVWMIPLTWTAASVFYLIYYFTYDWMDKKRTVLNR